MLRPVRNLYSRLRTRVGGEKGISTIEWIGLTAVVLVFLSAIFVYVQAHGGQVGAASGSSMDEQIALWMEGGGRVSAYRDISSSPFSGRPAETDPCPPGAGNLDWKGRALRVIDKWLQARLEGHQEFHPQGNPIDPCDVVIVVGGLNWWPPTWSSGAKMPTSSEDATNSMRYMLGEIGVPRDQIVPFSYRAFGYNPAKSGSDSPDSSPWTSEDYSPLDTRLDLDEQARRLWQGIQDFREANPGCKAHVIGHSQGGVVSEVALMKYYDPDVDGVANFVAIDSPVQGMTSAPPVARGLTPVFPVGLAVPAFLDILGQESASQFWASSDYWRELRRGYKMPGDIRVTSISGGTDTGIPPGMSTFPREWSENPANVCNIDLWGGWFDECTSTVDWWGHGTNRASQATQNVVWDVLTGSSDCESTLAMRVWHGFNRLVNRGERILWTDIPNAVKDAWRWIQRPSSGASGSW
jgi:pimeloyl-ACP methyl ester carboxylesterase